MRKLRITHVVVFLFLTVVMMAGFSFSTMAYWTYTPPGYEDYVPPKHVKLDEKKITLYKKCSATLTLEDASKNVQWSTTNNKIVRLKKKGNRVVIYWKKKGKCQVRAYYNGRMYTCAVTCKGIKKNAVFVGRDYRSVSLAVDDYEYWKQTDLYLWYGRKDVPIYYYLRNTDIYFMAEDPEIVNVTWSSSAWAFDDDDEDDLYTCAIQISALKPGRTRILITNSHNRKEIDYITVECKEL